MVTSSALPPLNTIRGEMARMNKMDNGFTMINEVLAN
jgi:hypothetical protein